MGVQIRRWTGANGGPTKTDITGINTRLNAYDGHSPNDTSYPIRIPASGENFSFWAVTRLYFSGDGIGTINNIEWYMDGGNGLGEGVELLVATAGAYDQATGTPGETGDELTVASYGNGTSDLDAEPVDAFTFDDESPLSVEGSVTDPDDEDFGDFVVMQLKVDNTAGPGATPTETATWLYDTTIA